jgi:outer membrane protein TolC
VNAYSNLYKAQENVRLLTEELAQSSKRDSDFAGMEKNGLLARNDMLKAQLQTTNIAYSLADAENNAKVAEVNMNLLLGLPENTALLPDSNSFRAQGAIETIEVYEKAALEHRSDAAAGRYRTRAAGVAVNTAKADYYPTVALSGGYVAAKIPNLFTVTNAVTYGIAVQYDLGSFWKTGAKVAQQKAREEQSSANEALLDDQIRLQINQSYADFLTAQKKIAVSNKAVEQGNENYRITNNKYKNGLVTTTDLLEADVSLLQARINLALAKVDAMVAYDTILERSGLLTDPMQVTSKR